MLSTQNPAGPFDLLPIEVLIVMFSFLSPEQVALSAKVNQKFKIAAADNFLWQEKLRKHFPHIYNKIEQTPDINWYAEFCSAYEAQYRVYDEKSKTYKPIPKRIRILFSLVKEGDINSLLESDLTLKDLEQRDVNGISLLDWAKKTNNQAVLDCFYKIALKEYQLNANTIDIVKADIQKRTILHWAILFHQLACSIDLLILQGADINVRLANGAHQQAIHLACMEGQFDIVKLLIEKQPTLLNQIDTCGQTPILWAASRGHAHIVKYLAKQGADLNLQSGNNAADTHGYTPLHWASKNGHTDAAKVLLKKNVRLDIPCNIGAHQQAIHIACMEGQFDIVKLLIEKQPTLLNQIDACGQTPILWAASRGHAHIVEYLAELGADLNLQSGNNAANTHGYTPLHWASKNGHTDAAKVLLKKNARLNTPCNIGAHQQAIHIACMEGQFDIVKLLIEKQPTLLNQIDAFGQTPILWAASRGHAHIVKYLAERGANLNLQSNNIVSDTGGYTPLHWASKNGHTTTIKILLKNHANIEILDNKNQTPAAVGIKDARYASELALLHYLAKIERRIQTKTRHGEHHKKSFTILGHTFDFGFSAQQKKDAAKALKSVVFDGADKSCLDAHQDALDNGDLKIIKHNLRIK